ncbi:MAG: cytochrome P450 [Porticoccaceae bacterium]|nr:cytochrome P450 [Porticoccaceae bacterium]
MPEAQNYDLTDSKVMADPYAFYRAIHRDDAKVVNVTGVGGWVGRMSDVKRIAKQTELFSNSYFDEGGPIPTGVSGQPLEEDVKDIFNQGPEVVNALWTTDPPVHTTHRKLVNKAFTSKWVRSIEPRIEAIAHELIDKFASQSRVEFIHQYAVYLPMIVISEALGMAVGDAENFKRWSDDILRGNLDVLDHEQRKVVARSFVEANLRFETILNLRRKNPQSDLISSLAAAKIGDTCLANKEALPIINTTMLAGNETTTNLIGNAMKILLDNVDYVHQLREDKSLITPFLDEVMRFECPVQCLYRIVTEDTQIGNYPLEQGSRVMLGWGSAGRDPDYFDQPDEFILNRANAHRHIGFGWGPHVCVGLGLARAEARIAIAAILDRLEHMTLINDYKPKYVPTFATRGFQDLQFSFCER